MVIVNVVLSPLIARYSCLERVALKTAWRISCPAMPTTVHVYVVPLPPPPPTVWLLVHWALVRFVHLRTSLNRPSAQFQVCCNGMAAVTDDGMNIVVEMMVAELAQQTAPDCRANDSETLILHRKVNDALESWGLVAFAPPPEVGSRQQAKWSRAIEPGDYKEFQNGAALCLFVRAPLFIMWANSDQVVE